MRPHAAPARALLVMLASGCVACAAGQPAQALVPSLPEAECVAAARRWARWLPAGTVLRPREKWHDAILGQGSVALVGAGDQVTVFVDSQRGRCFCWSERAPGAPLTRKLLGHPPAHGAARRAWEAAFIRRWLTPLRADERLETIASVGPDVSRYGVVRGDLVRTGREILFSYARRAGCLHRIEEWTAVADRLTIATPTLTADAALHSALRVRRAFVPAPPRQTLRDYLRITPYWRVEAVGFPPGPAHRAVATADDAGGVRLVFDVLLVGRTGETRPERAGDGAGDDETPGGSGPHAAAWCLVDARTGEVLPGPSKAPLPRRLCGRELLHWRVGNRTLFTCYPPRVHDGAAHLWSGYLQSAVWRGSARATAGHLNVCYAGHRWWLADGLREAVRDGQRRALAWAPRVWDGEWYLPGDLVAAITGWQVFYDAPAQTVWTGPASCVMTRARQPATE